MPQTTDQRRASGRVAAWLAAHERNNLWLAEKANVDAGTVGDFLAGLRWPQKGTQGKIEKALGWQPGAIHQIASGSDPEAVGAPIHTEPDPVFAPGPRVEGSISNEELYSLLIAMRAESDQMRAAQNDLASQVRGLRERVEQIEESGP